MGNVGSEEEVWRALDITGRLHIWLLAYKEGERSDNMLPFPSRVQKEKCWGEDWYRLNIGVF